MLATLVTAIFQHPAPVPWQLSIRETNQRASPCREWIFDLLITPVEVWSLGLKFTN